MGNVVDLQTYKDSKNYEEEYLKFLSYVNKYDGVPSDFHKLVKMFYFILRYLEGTVNCFTILSALGKIKEKDVQETREMVKGYLQSILDDI